MCKNSRAFRPLLVFLIGDNDKHKSTWKLHSLFIRCARVWLTRINGSAIALLLLRPGQSNTPVEQKEKYECFYLSHSGVN